MEKTVRKAFALLEQLAGERAPQRMTDIALRAGLTKANAHRLLSTLCELGYVSKDESTRYRTTLKLWEVGRRMLADGDLQAAARDVMTELRDATGHSVALGMLDEGSMVYVAKIDGSTPIRAVAQVGTRRPATATAIGKAILAWRPPQALDEAMPQVRPLTPHTLINREDIEADLEATRRRGYATTRSESWMGVCAVAAPIFDATGSPVAGISVWGADDEMGDPVPEAVVRETMEAARRISGRLGYVGSLAPVAPLSPASPASSRQAEALPLGASLPARPGVARSAAPASRRRRDGA